MAARELGDGVEADGFPPAAEFTGFATGMAALTPGADFVGAGVALDFDAGCTGVGSSDSGAEKVIGVFRSTIRFTVWISFFVGSMRSR